MQFSKFRHGVKFVEVVIILQTYVEKIQSQGILCNAQKKIKITVMPTTASSRVSPITHGPIIKLNHNSFSSSTVIRITQARNIEDNLKKILVNQDQMAAKIKN